MKADLFYNSAPGRMLLRSLQSSGAFKAAALFLRSGASRPLIAPFIRKNGVDMTPFQGQSYRSFADFFAREKALPPYIEDEDVLISPCDGLLSIYPVTGDMVLPMKDSHYLLSDLLPREETAALFAGGLCLVYRLQATDYHHFCHFDDCVRRETHYIPGQLHSVQPIACRTVPVYRLNRRWWTLMDTDHFGPAAQIEVGAMLVGGVTHAGEPGRFPKGSEMGNFELAGSTIVLLLTAQARCSLTFFPRFAPALEGAGEVAVSMGEGVGRRQKEAAAAATAALAGENVPLSP